MKTWRTPKSIKPIKFEHKYGFLTERSHLDSKTQDFYDRVCLGERPFLQVQFNPDSPSNRNSKFEVYKSTPNLKLKMATKLPAITRRKLEYPLLEKSPKTRKLRQAPLKPMFDPRSSRASDL
jgi:hypothetical protein